VLPDERSSGRASSVLLDVVLEREPWVEDATALLDAVAKGRAAGFVASHRIPTVSCMLAQERDRAAASTATMRPTQKRTNRADLARFVAPAALGAHLSKLRGG
jgi:predicted nucleic acid-binding protein